VSKINLCTRPGFLEELRFYGIRNQTLLQCHCRTVRTGITLLPYYC